MYNCIKIYTNKGGISLRRDTIISLYTGSTLIREQACYCDGQLTPNQVWSFIRETNMVFALPPDCTYKLRQVDNTKTTRMKPFDYRIPVGNKVVPFKACPSCQCNLLRNPQDIKAQQCSNCGQLLK